jgi:dihydrofolate reductase
MSKVRVHNFAVSLDGFATGEGQSLEAPFGHAGGRLMEWFFGTRAFQSMNGKDGGSEGVDNAYASAWGLGIGAEIMGRNKFGPHRGVWQDEEWKGWWGDNPPFHTPVFVLTHHPRPTLEMEGGNTFHFIDASPAEALAQARDAAGGLDVRIGGGPSTVRQFLAADLIDHLHVVLVPIVLGRGVRLWDGLESLEDRFTVESVTAPSGVTHLTFARRYKAEYLQRRKSESLARNDRLRSDHLVPNRTHSSAADTARDGLESCRSVVTWRALTQGWAS